MKKPRNATIFFICLVVFILLVRCSSSNEPEKPKTIKNISTNIISVNANDFVRDDDQMTIAVKSNLGTLSDIAFTALNVFQEMQKSFSGEMAKYKHITVFAHLDLVDNYGNPSQKRTIGLTWQTSDLFKVNFASNLFSTSSLLNLASDVRVFEKPGFEMFTEYCNDTQHFKATTKMCVLYLQKYITH